MNFLPSLAHKKSLVEYILNANRLPILSLEEEQLLFRKFKDHGDLVSGQKLVISHLRLVIKMAQKLRGYKIDINDLIQEGVIGLIKALNMFNPDLNVRLSSFATHWIKAEMFNFILKNWRIVNIATTKTQRRLFFSLRKVRQSLGHEANHTRIASAFNIKPSLIFDMEERMHSQDLSFDTVYQESEPLFYLTHNHTSPEEVAIVDDWNAKLDKAIKLVMSSLDQRAQDIVANRLYHVETSTLRDLALKYKISIERVRQIEKIAVDKIKSLMNKMTAY